MKYKEERNRITIEPTTDVEIAYIEEVFGMKKEGDEIHLVRKNAMGLGCIAYLETKIIPQQREMVHAWQPTTIAEFLTNSSTPQLGAKMVEDFAYKIHKELHQLNTYEADEAREFYLGEIQSALNSGNYERVATLAMILSQPD